MRRINIHIRWMIRRDMPEVLAIENSLNYSLEEEDILSYLRQRNCIGMVAEAGGKIVGHMIYELHIDKLGLMRFAVHPDHRRCTIGEQMVKKLKSKLSHHRRTHVNCIVPDDDLCLHLFLRSQGFKASNVLRTYYDNGDDAYLFRMGIEEEALV